MLMIKRYFLFLPLLFLAACGHDAPKKPSTAKAMALLFPALSLNVDYFDSAAVGRPLVASAGKQFSLPDEFHDFDTADAYHAVGTIEADSSHIAYFLRVNDRQHHLQGIYLYSSPDSAFQPSAPLELWIQTSEDTPSFKRNACLVTRDNRMIVMRQTNYIYSDVDRTEFYTYSQMKWEGDHYVERKIEEPSESVKKLFPRH